MTQSLCLALPLLATCALADVATPPQQQPPAPTPKLTSLENELRAQYHNPLQAILAFVHDKASADAAAPRVKALTSTPPAGTLQAAPEVWLFVYFGSSCFGSTELMDAMRPLLPRELSRMEQFRSTISPLLQEFLTTLHAHAGELEQVTDADSAAHAAAELKNLQDYLKSWSKRMEKELLHAEQQEAFSRDDSYFMLALYQIHPLPGIGHLRHAYGRAQARTEGGFPILAEAMQAAWEPLQSITAAKLCPEHMTPDALIMDERIGAAFGEWMDVASSITDKASADAAADWLEAKNTELGRSLIGACYAAPCYGASPSALLGILLEASLTYFDTASPPCFGSEELQQLLDAKPENYMPVPAVRPLPAEHAPGQKKCP